MRAVDKRAPHRRGAVATRLHVGAEGGNRRWGATPAARVVLPWEASLYHQMRGAPRDEVRLWATVVVTALRDFLTPSRRVDAAGWFASLAVYPGSFLWCCDHLGLEARVVRAGLLEMRRAERIAPLVLDVPLDMAIRA